MRALLREHLPQGFEERLGYGMPAFVVPHDLYPAGYHCDPSLPLPFVSFANQKNFVALYHMGLYASPEDMAWFKASWDAKAPANWTWARVAFDSRTWPKSLGPCLNSSPHE